MSLIPGMTLVYRFQGPAPEIPSMSPGPGGHLMITTGDLVHPIICKREIIIKTENTGATESINMREEENISVKKNIKITEKKNMKGKENILDMAMKEERDQEVAAIHESIMSHCPSFQDHLPGPRTTQIIL